MAAFQVPFSTWILFFPVTRGQHAGSIYLRLIPCLNPKSLSLLRSLTNETPPLFVERSYSSLLIVFSLTVFNTFNHLLCSVQLRPHSPVQSNYLSLSFCNQFFQRLCYCFYFLIPHNLAHTMIWFLWASFWSQKNHQWPMALLIKSMDAA